jgi:hypothetical protein
VLSHKHLCVDFFGARTLERNQRVHGGSMSPFQGLPRCLPQQPGQVTFTVRDSSKCFTSHQHVFPFFFDHTGVWSQGFVLIRQAPYLTWATLQSLCVTFETGSCCVAQAGLQHPILPSQLPVCWCDCCALPAGTHFPFLNRMIRIPVGVKQHFVVTVICVSSN